MRQSVKNSENPCFNPNQYFHKQEDLKNPPVLAAIFRNSLSKEDKKWREYTYGKVLIKLPAPRFVVFYNGVDPQPGEQVLRLSDAFEKRMEK